MNDRLESIDPMSLGIIERNALFGILQQRRDRRLDRAVRLVMARHPAKLRLTWQQEFWLRRRLDDIRAVFWCLEQSHA